MIFIQIKKNEIILIEKNTVFDLKTKIPNFMMKIQAIEKNLASVKLTLEN